MNQHQKTYKALTTIWGFLIFWNLFLGIGLLLGGAVAHTPLIMSYALSIWFFVSIIGVILLVLTIKGVPVLKEGGPKLIVMVIMVCVSALPTLPLIFQGATSSYINSWEIAHCQQIGLTNDTNPWPILKCDSGDVVEKPTDPNDTRRFYDNGGIKTAHYPYSFFY